jgi:hypothetical protein
MFSRVMAAGGVGGGVGGMGEGCMRGLYEGQEDDGRAARGGPGGGACTVGQLELAGGIEL